MPALATSRVMYWSMFDRFEAAVVSKVLDGANTTSDRRAATLRRREGGLENGPEQGRDGLRSSRPLIQSIERRGTSEATEVRLDAAKEALSPTE